MAAINARASAVDATNGATWASTANAIDGAFGSTPATYATWTSSTANATGYIELGGFDFSSIPALSTIDSISVTLRHVENNTTRISVVNFQPYDGATPIGSSFNCTRSTTARDDTTTFNPTLAQVQSAAFTIRVNVTHNNGTQSGIFSVDHVDVTVNYTPPASITVKRYGTDWTTTATVKRYGTDWTTTATVKRWNGSQWV